MSLSGKSSDILKETLSEADSAASSDEATSVKEISTDEGGTYSSVSEVTTSTVYSDKDSPTSASDHPLEGCSNDDE